MPKVRALCVAGGLPDFAEGALPALTSLGLYSSLLQGQAGQLSGAIPASITHLRNLRTLEIFYNQAGTQTMVCQLTLAALTMFPAQLSGGLEVLANSSLSTLRAGNNSFSLPRTLPSAMQVYLDGNPFDG